MKFSAVITAGLILHLLASNALAKGGGGHSSGGHSGHTSGDDHSSGSGSGSHISEGESGFSSPSKASTTGIGSYLFSSGSHGYSHGGYGYRDSNAPTYVWNRYYYTNYRVTYGGAWSYGFPYGWYGIYNPSIIYWYYIPSFAYPGYQTKYYRYNEQTGAFYAPELDVVGNGSPSVLINTTDYTDDINNCHDTFDFSISTGFPNIDSAYSSSSDPTSTPADFYFRLIFWQLVEYTDTNDNGAFDDGVDTVVFSIPLNNVTVPWTSLTFQNKTVETNRTYQEATTTASLASASKRMFNISLTFRASNIEVNSTFVLPIIPNAAMFDFLISGYTFKNSSSNLALLTLLTTSENCYMDINSTDPAVVTQIKTNATVGVSIGDYSEGRLEWNSNVNVNNLTSASYVQSAMALLVGEPSPIQAYLLGNTTTPDPVSVLAVTIPPGSYNVAAGTANLSGFTFLDADVLNNDNSAASSLWRQGMNLHLATLSAFGAMLWLLLL
ncbi:hypothetical protein BC937DRAFT_93005 [Endogone sp. FLAS-F59071]|nr:hypothetical protein BC937DRAFT_93005 [Endogone sp. FLAS-F59071]|eukprot:RUS23050.1 hypothetical protein BC937DRAFT_93005 [Endogone sp. FLAS-F59071]